MGAASQKARRRPRPAAYRRRRAALTVLAILSAILGAVVGADRDQQPDMATATSLCRQEGPGAMVGVAGQGVMVRMERRATPRLLRQARAGEIGGVILFPDAEVRRRELVPEIARVRAAALQGGNPPLLVAIDQEGGAVERLPALAPAFSPFTIAENDDRRQARLEGRATGFQLRERAIDVNLAPVLDVPSSPEHFMTLRAFGSSAAQVSRLGLAFATGQQREAVAATAKHFPGLGRAIENTDLAPTSIPASARALERDLAPFRAAVRAGVRLVMVGLASYPALGEEAPAALSRAIVSDLLRGELGFEGVIVSDDLLAPAVSASDPAPSAALRASQAGVDLLLFARRPVRGIARGLARAAALGQLDPESLRESCERIGRLKAELQSGEPLE